MWLLDSTSKVVIGGHSGCGGALEGGEYRFQTSQSLLSDEHPCSNSLELAVHDTVVVLFLGLCHGNPLGLGGLGLGGDDLGSVGAMFTVLVTPQLLGLLKLPPLHRGHIYLRHWEHDLVTGGRGEYVWVLVGLKGRSRLLGSTSKVGSGGHSVVGVLWRVVSVGSKLLSLYSQIDTRVAILLNLLFATLWSYFVFRTLSQRSSWSRRAWSQRR